MGDLGCALITLVFSVSAMLLCRGKKAEGKGGGAVHPVGEGGPNGPKAVAIPGSFARSRTTGGGGGGGRGGGGGGGAGNKANAGIALIALPPKEEENSKEGKGYSTMAMVSYF